LPAGRAVATAAGRLSARYVIHTVGPVWQGGERDEAAVLAGCHRECIGIADELGLEVIAFPAISTGVYGYPIHLAAAVALPAVADALRAARRVATVRFVLWDAPAYRAYREEAHKTAAAPAPPREIQ
jgi:O-acetyl-ADP-ribose deacetylase (regulator of RNase III)